MFIVICGLRFLFVGGFDFGFGNWKRAIFLRRLLRAIRRNLCIGALRRIRMLGARATRINARASERRARALCRGVLRTSKFMARSPHGADGFYCDLGVRESGLCVTSCLRGPA